MDGNEGQSAPTAADGAGAPTEPSEGAGSPRPPTGSPAPDGAPPDPPAGPSATPAPTPPTAPPDPPASPAQAPAAAPSKTPSPAPAATPSPDGSSAGAGRSPAPAPPPTSSTPEPPPAPDVRPAGPPAYGAARQAPPKIFDLPDQAPEPGAKDARANGSTLVLGGAAAAEGRTTGPNPRIAGAAPATTTTRTSEGGEAAGEGDEPRGRHFASVTADRNLLPLALAAIPVVLFVLLIGGWAVDTAALSGQVMRNVEVAGRSVGGLGEASLPDVMAEIDEEVAARPVRITADDKVYETTAGEIGLSVDTEATAEAALDAGRSDSLLTRPFSWFASFFSPREVDLEYVVSESHVLLKMTELQSADLVNAGNPTIELGEDGWVAVPGVPGEGVDPGEIAAALPAAAEAQPTGTIEIETARVPISPEFTDEEAQALADHANTITANGLTLIAGDTSKQVDAATLRTWIAPTTDDGELALTIVPDAVNAALPEIFSDLSSEPVDASFTLEGGSPVVVPSKPGVTCCEPSSPDLVWQALQAGEPEVALEATVVEPELTTEMAEGLGIVQPVGGNHAWRNGAPTTAGPGFTTYHDCCAARVTNIHRMADIVRGTVVLPGETFSINETVGQRTTAKGFVPAGAIAQGEHVDEIGGGVSQFATTTFNAAYFAGLDIPVYQAHSEYFSRYPLGREATMGYPNPDLQFTNNTPYGILIWTSYTDTSLTVTLYSTPYATGEQTGISESNEGQCRIVTTTRTRTWPDGRTENDTFRARYRPGPGLNCDGQPINPNPDPD